MSLRLMFLRGFLGTVALVCCVATAEAAIRGVAFDGSKVCALTTDNQVVCWTTAGVRTTVTKVQGLPQQLTAITAGKRFFCALSGAGAVWCWGDNTNGTLGDGTLQSREVPAPVTGLSGGVTAIASKRSHSCAVTAEAKVVCWGSNTSGELGDGTVTTRRTTPVPVSGLPQGIARVGTGVDHSCAITTSGNVYCWGSNNRGQLGDGTTSSRFSAVAVAGLPAAVAGIAPGWEHTCAFMVTGETTCWGSNGSGQLGDGTTTESLTPRTLSGLSGTTALASGDHHTCALDSGGTVRCWGWLGGSAGKGSVPTAVAGLPPGVVLLAAEDFGTCAATANAVWCWDRLETPAPYYLSALAADLKLLVFGALSNGSAFTVQTGPQSVRISQSEGAATRWTASTDQPWLSVSPQSGSGPGILTVTVRFTPGLAATQTGHVSLAAEGNGNVVGTTVVLNVRPGPEPPTGGIETPTGGATALAGSVAVTGWALDHIGVKRVEIWRDLQPGETTAPFSGPPGDPRNGKAFIANATFVDGARPDLERPYGGLPFSYRAGWGYLLLTWGLWNQGNGTYTIHAYAIDEEDSLTLLNSKTIVVDNNSATRPFGAIDTPGMGSEASGPNFGWALTPKVNGVATCRIPASGVQVSIDSGPLQPVVYGTARPDIAAAFPGFANSASAGGHFLFDWSTLANGTHTIAWLVTDDCGRADGVGSRFFNVSTGTAASGLTAAVAGLSAAARAAPMPGRESTEPVIVMRGDQSLGRQIAPDESGVRVVTVPQGERIVIRLPRGFAGITQLGPDGSDRPLPIGSTWDAASGTFYWQPAPAFLGAFSLVFTNGAERISVRVLVVP